MNIEKLYPACVLKTNDVEGRYIVASKDLAEGDLIIDELPVVRCPPYSTKPLCLGCYRFIEKGDCVICPKCTWPMCSKECCNNQDHLLECAIFHASGAKIKLKELNFETFEPLYDVLTPVRMLALKKARPEAWKSLNELMHHLDQWKSAPGWIEEHEPACNYILKNLPKLDVCKDDILRLFGIGYINDFSTSVGDSRVRVAYPNTAMISHDCTPNVIRFICGLEEDNKILCYASRPIKKGEKLSITYVDLLQPSMFRKEILKRSKHFECVCQKCQDPTELGSYGSSLRCQKCASGYVNPPKWRCEGKCNGKSGMPPKQAEEVIRKAQEAIDELMNDQSLWTVKAFEEFIDKYQDKLHPQNLCLIRAKNSLVGFYGRSPGFEVHNLVRSPTLLDRKTQLALEVLKVLDIIEPGISAAKGLLQYELHMPTFLKAQVNLGMGLIDTSDAIPEFERSLEYVEKSLEHLKFECQGSFGYELKVGAENAQSQLQGVIQQFKNA